MRSRKLNFVNGSALFDLFEFRMALAKELAFIKKNYKDFFDENSNQTIDEVINTFQKINHDIVKLSNPAEEVELAYAATYPISGKRLNMQNLAPLVNKLFDLEDECQKVVQKIWKNELTPIENLENGKKFKILIKMLATWRTDVDSPEKIQHMQNRFASSYSLISDNDLRTFQVNNPTYGLIAKINDGFMAAKKSNAMLEERIHNVNPFETVRIHDDINRIYLGEEHEVYTKSLALKVITPSSLLLETSEYNEVIVDKRKVENQAVFYFSYGHPLISKDYAKAVALSQKLRLPLKEIKIFNLSPTLRTVETNNRFKLVESEILKQSRHYGHGLKQLSISLCSLVFQPQFIEMGLNNKVQIAAKIFLKNPKTQTELKKNLIEILLQTPDLNEEMLLPNIKKVLSAQIKPNSNTKATKTMQPKINKEMQR